MPSDKKRVNLTIPDPIYEKLQAYKEQVGLFNDATACLQLIVQQLNSMEVDKLMYNALRNSSAEQLSQLSSEGLSLLKEAIDKGLIGPPQKNEVL